MSRRRLLLVASLALVAALAIPALDRMREDRLGHDSSAADEGAMQPRRIAGGTFEASGVAHVAGTSRVLFVDDGRERDVYIMELAADGRQRGEAARLTLPADVTDMEGVTTNGRHFYIVGSQSKNRGFDGDGLVRFTLDTTTGAIADVERIQGLKAWLARNVAELRGTERRIGDDVLNIEGLAWDPRDRRLLLGLRAPVVDGSALVVPVKLRDTVAGFTADNLVVDGATIRLSLGGAGIRGIEFDGEARAFLVITGASLNDENRDFRILEWDGRSGAPTREIATFPRELKPEGITRAVLDGRSVRVVVFDASHVVVLPSDGPATTSPSDTPLTSGPP